MEHATTEVWPTFDDFYNAYQKKVGRVNAEKQWAKLKQKDKEELMQHVPLYVKSREKKYRKDPERYLKHRTWEDEIIGGVKGEQQSFDAIQDALARRLAARRAAGATGAS